VSDALLGAAIGLAASYLPHVLYKALRKQSGQGLGDVKLVVMVGAWQGPIGALFVIFAGSAQSALAALVMRLLGLSYPVPASVRAEIDDLRAKAAAGDEEAKELLADDPMAADAGEGLLATRLPLGPFLALACLELVFANEWILAILKRLTGR
jgi:leader peptidase (prepilin peptidase)/N-methyltransferase